MDVQVETKQNKITKQKLTVTHRFMQVLQLFIFHTKCHLCLSGSTESTSVCLNVSLYAFLIHVDEWTGAVDMALLPL